MFTKMKIQISNRCTLADSSRFSDNAKLMPCRGIRVCFVPIESEVKGRDLIYESASNERALAIKLDDLSFRGQLTESSVVGFGRRTRIPARV